jgi:diguanylate cyclase
VLYDNLKAFLTLDKNHKVFEHFITTFFEDFKCDNIYYEVSKASYTDHNIHYLKYVENFFNNLLTKRTKDFQYSLNKISVINKQCAVPYLIVVGQVNFFRNRLLSLLLRQEASSDIILELSNLCNYIEENIARIYLKHFLIKFKQRNIKKLSLVQKNLDTNIMSPYTKHLDWINELINALLNKSTKIPELDHHTCQFGSWLYKEGKHKVFDRHTFDDIVHTHTELHKIAINILDIHQRQTKNREFMLYQHLYIFIKKFELTIMHLANEIILLNNIIVSDNSTKDELTQLFNRSLLKTVFYNQYDIVKITESRFSIIMGDVDHFKKINDSYGHIAGDGALVHISDILKEHFRTSDFIFRYGGEEFLIILPNTKEKQAISIAESLRQKIESSTFMFEENRINLTASFGVLEISSQNCDTSENILMSDYLEKVDMRLYYAKESGRNQVK